MIDTPETAAVPLARTAEDPTALLHQMVRIDSVNPALVPGAAGEAGLAEFASAWFQQRGFEVTRLEEVKNRPSVVAIARGSGGGKTLMFNGHLDTVTLAGYDGDPLEPRIENGCMFGRGTFDMKAGIAAMMIAAAEAAALPHRGDIIVALVADEEYASAGTEEVLRHFSADATIVSEPTHEDIVFAHGGFVWCDVTIHGTAAHGSRSDLGVDAIAKAGRFLTGLQDLSLRLKNSTGHPSIGPGSVHASLVSGGEEYSSYPATCTVSIERRTVPGESAETLIAELLAILDPIAQEDPDFSYTLNTVLERKPLEVSKDSPIVETVSAAARDITGKAPVLRGEPFWTDASLMLEKAIPGILFGVDGGGAHAATEWVDLGSLHRVTRILSAAATEFCQ
ncbi:acetylornithine deacetylase [Arthrobacter sp. W1]|nr:acetylornithine deacetylase [Arthrobacter sp. W1]